MNDEHGLSGVVDPGGFVAERFGVRLHTDQEASVVPVGRLVGLALRKNPRRAHLLVSTVLAKHVPTDPATTIAAGALLGVLVAELLAAEGGVPRLPSARARAFGDRLTEVLEGRGRADGLRALLVDARVSDPALSVIGYAETATGLGRIVADTLGAAYIHSTRLDVPGSRSFAGFEEEHSHATSHRLLPRRSDWFRAGGTVVLVDDEVSTGSTIINTIRSLHAVVPQRRWVVAALIDLRSGVDRARFDALAAELGAAIDVVALGTGSIDLPSGLLDEAQRFFADTADAVVPDAHVSAPGAVSLVDLRAHPPVPLDRFGTLADERPDLLAGSETARALAAAVAAEAAVPRRDPQDHDSPPRVLVLGTEEAIALPLAVADALREATTAEVVFSTTTRSPIHPLDRGDYAIQTAVRFDRHDRVLDDEPRRYAYNLTRGGERFDEIVLVPEPGTPEDALTGPGSVTEALAGVASRVTVILLTAPLAPSESSRA
ncbi:phosphoribosyltransferase domain-containing protein [Frondihabitans peucedani]|uniref:TRSP domain C terminus to PRTase_2 n=1 Tax=Frondihabitans peucedani TaxID=598626 RepID=A0ABP8DXG2_9MICO